MRWIAIALGSLVLVGYLLFLPRLVGCASWVLLVSTQGLMALSVSFAFAELSVNVRFCPDYWRALRWSAAGVFLFTFVVASAWRAPGMIRCI